MMIYFESSVWWWMISCGVYFWTIAVFEKALPGRERFGYSFLDAALIFVAIVCAAVTTVVFHPTLFIYWAIVIMFAVMASEEKENNPK